ncbi:NUDIX hydrolase [uncultured Bifidobacterium sp.]|uniref:NUDIX hydrolase n=1 Tax=uncultured Bifidobacterium sp. TaxID=165187 RepID=UPI002584BB65|nr:NUDIX hydrolase [uncultured Bifidobacterium sp.]MEE0653977.1 NUDIX hydrolase [Bifidobacterium criceti]
MTTPADVARMLANAAANHARGPLAPDELMYTSQSETLRFTTREPGTSHASGTQDAPRTPNAAATPTPAIMPRRRTSDRPTTFASLDAQELPIVREYSAGGLVFDTRGRVAIIARHSRSGHLEWCLPKGHIEKGETPQQTAVREVHEETGILGEVVDSIATIDYWFTGTSQRVHKLVHHFALRQVGGELTVEGDPDHEAEDAIWVDFADLDDVLSYPNERKIAWLYARKLNRQG